jgi:hypothetical protein
VPNPSRVLVFLRLGWVTMNPNRLPLPCIRARLQPRQIGPTKMNEGCSGWAPAHPEQPNQPPSSLNLRTSPPKYSAPRLCFRLTRSINDLPFGL